MYVTTSQSLSKPAVLQFQAFPKESSVHSHYSVNVHYTGTLEFYFQLLLNQNKTR